MVYCKIFVIVLSLLTPVFFLTSCSEPSSTHLIELNPAIVQLGKIDVTQSANTHIIDGHFMIKNVASERIVIEKIEADCGCLIPGFESPVEIEPSTAEFVPLKLTLSSSLSAGPFNKLIRIVAKKSSGLSDVRILKVAADIHYPRLIDATPDRILLGRIPSWRSYEVEVVISHPECLIDQETLTVHGCGRLESVERITGSSLRCLFSVCEDSQIGKLSDNIVLSSPCGEVVIPVTGTIVGPGPISDEETLVFHENGAQKSVLILYPGQRPDNVSVQSSEFDAQIVEIEHLKLGYLKVTLALQSEGPKHGQIFIQLSNSNHPIAFNVYCVWS